MSELQLTLADFLPSLVLVSRSHTLWDWPCFWQEFMRLIFSFWERVTASNLCGGGQALLVAKIAHTRSWMEGGVALQLSLEEGDQLGDCSYLWRLFATIAHADNPLTCPCVDGHLSGGTLHSWNSSKLSVVSILFVFSYTLFVTSTGIISWTLNFENGVLRNGQQLQCARRAWLQCSWSYEDTECSWISRWDKRQFLC